MDAQKILPAVTEETGPNPDTVVIWLHGLGASGYDFSPILPELGLPKEWSIRFIFPHAPHMPVTVNGGMVMPAWFDIMEMGLERKVDIAGLRGSADLITAMIEAECAQGIDSRRVFLAGFSQGGAVAYETALRYENPLGGLLAMSTYFATAETIILHEANAGLPVEIHHGSYDQVVPEHLGQNAALFLQEKGYQVTYRTYPMEHSVCPQQIEHIGAWFRELLQPE